LQHPAATLFLLIGADQYAELDSWREPAALRQLATVAVLSRAGWAPVSPPDITVPVTRIDITSTEVRRRVRDQLPVRYLIPDAVDGIIRREKLYVGHEAG
jgi:nicotinate-nucleotide adenylyltransferase